MELNQIYIGYIQGTHGLGGYLKVKCKFSCLKKVFIPLKHIYLNNEEHIISQCKLHKGFYLIQIDDLKDINLVEKYIGYDVYINRDELNLKEDEYLIEDLKDMKVIELESKLPRGKVVDIIDAKVQKILVLDSSLMVPLVKKYIERIDTNNHVITLKNIKELEFNLK